MRGRRWPSESTGASFMREVVTGAWESDMGLWQPDAATVLRDRRRFDRDDLGIFMNITPEFASSIGRRTPADTARSTVVSSLADVILVSGPMAGAEPELTTVAVVAHGRPGLAFVRPVVRLQAVALVEMGYRRRTLTGTPQMIGKFEMRGPFGHRHRSRLRSGDHFFRAEHELASGALGDPITDGVGVAVAVLTGTQRRGLSNAATRRLLRGFRSDELRYRFHQRCGHRRLTTRPTRLGRAHDHAVLVDPHDVRDVDHTEQCVHLVGWIKQRGMLRLRRLDEGTRRFWAAHLQRYGHDFETLGVKLIAQRLPHGQVESAASVWRPRHDHDLLAEQR